MPSAYDNMSKQALRATFKREHFDLSATDFDLLFKQYHATNMLYKNTEDRWKFRLRETGALYDAYQDYVLETINKDKKYMLSVELKNCRDLICLEYIQKSPKFNRAFYDALMALRTYVQNYQRTLKDCGIPDDPGYNRISLAEACFILYLYPGVLDTVKYLCAGFKVSEPMLAAVEKGNQAQAQQRQAKYKHSVTPGKIVIRQAWQVGKIK